MTGPAIDYERLRNILASPAGASMPEALKARMTQDIAYHDQEQQIRQRPDASLQPGLQSALSNQQATQQTAQYNAENPIKANIAGAAFLPAQFAMQVGHDLTLGIAPSPYSKGDNSSMPGVNQIGEVPIKLAASITAMIMQGRGLLTGLSYVGKVPIVTRALEFIPGRLREIGIGALLNGGLDAMRADGLDRQPNGAINDATWLDPASKIAKPLAELGIPDRLAMGIGGAVVGGAIGGLLLGVARGWQLGRESAAPLLTAKVSAAAKEGLIRAGIDVGTEGDTFIYAKTFIKNFRKVAMNEDLAAPMADQLTREAYIAGEINFGSANSASPASDIGDMAHSGFYIKPDAAVVLPNAKSLRTPTIEAVRQAMDKVGPEEFRVQVEAEIAKRSGDPLAQAAATEEVSRRIIAGTSENIISVHPYPAKGVPSPIRDVAVGLKTAEPTAVEMASTAMAPKIPQESVLIPLPDSKGSTAANLALAQAIAAKNGATVSDALVGAARESQYARRQAGQLGQDAANIPLSLKGERPIGNVVLVDNVHVSGATADAARKAIGDPTAAIAVWADDAVARAAEFRAKMVGTPQAAQDMEQQGRLMAGIFRQNPGGVNVVTNLTSDAAVLAAQERLGVKLAVAKIGGVPPVGTGTTLGASPAILKEISNGAPGVALEVGDGQINAIARNQAGKPIGSLIVTDAGKGPLRAFEVVVDPANRRQGIATSMYQKVKDAYPDRSLITGSAGLSTEGNALAQSLNKQGIATLPTFDLLIGRPTYEYPAFEDQATFGKLTNKVTNVLKKMASETAQSVRAPKTTEAFILADGEPIRGGLNTTAMIEKMRLQKPIVDGVERGDIGLREAGKFVRLDLTDVDKLSIDLPKQLSKEQFISIGKAIDTMKFSEVTLNFGQKSVVLNTPIGAVVQDRIAEMIPPKSIGTSITPEMVQQYKRSGVFAGQAAVLPDGTAAEIIHKRGAAGYRVRETLTGSEFNIGEKNLTILPTALKGEFQGSNLFASYMSNEERNALAKLRKAQLEGWAEPIKKYRDFESYANTRGYMAEQLRAGKLRLSKVNEGGASPILFKDIPSAIEWIRKDTAPMAELANEEVTKLLGPDRNIGWIGGGGPPPRFQELMPVDWKRMEITMETLPTDRGPGFFESRIKPMIPFMRDLDKRFGTQMYKVASNMQSQRVASDNFLSLWWYGKGGKLPNGITPLEDIVHDLGPKADRELIGHWLEVKKGTPDEMDLLARMSPQERKAGERLRDWFAEAYPALGIGAPFIEDYMPRYRAAIQSGDGKTFQEFMASVVNDPLKVPKGTDFISDHIREGLIDAYESDPFKVAVQYLRAGAKNRFMKQAHDEAGEMVRMVASKNENLALPLANMLQAMGGYEFGEQRAMIKETFMNLLEKIPGGATSISGRHDIAEKFTDWSTSLVYSSTMGFRPSLALRNAKDIYVMAYPIYAGPRFNEAIGRALTQGGKEEAMAARAISEYAGGMLTAETQDMLAKLPEWAQKVQHASTFLYDSADSFTRAGAYFAAKFKAEDALSVFAKRVENVSNPKLLQEAKDQLVRDSKVYFHGQEAIDEFLRRAANSPDKATEYAGKLGADMTNFLYGRGMQGRWMRSIAGRLMGQFGSWSMWYADYLNTMIRAVGNPTYRGDALGALGRHVLVNAAIVGVGKAVLDVDLSRWASYGALFYSGGPGWQLAVGASTLQRGLGDASSAGEDPLAQTRISQGSQIIWQTLPAFVPFMSAARDVYRMATPFDQTDFLAATLGTRTTKDYQMRRKVDILLGDYRDPFQSTSPMLHNQLNNAVSGEGVQAVDVRELPPGGVQTQGVGPPVVPTSAGQGMQVSASSKNQGGVALPNLPTGTPAGVQSNLSNEVKSSSEVKPPRTY